MWSLYVHMAVLNSAWQPMFAVYIISHQRNILSDRRDYLSNRFCKFSHNFIITHPLPTPHHTSSQQLCLQALYSLCQLAVSSRSHLLMCFICNFAHTHGGAQAVITRSGYGCHSQVYGTPTSSRPLPHKIHQCCSSIRVKRSISTHKILACDRTRSIYIAQSAVFGKRLRYDRVNHIRSTLKDTRHWRHKTSCSHGYHVEYPQPLSPLYTANQRSTRQISPYHSETEWTTTGLGIVGVPSQQTV